MASSDRPSDLAQILQLGMGHFQAGRLPQAEALFRQVLAAEPTNAAALDMLGCIAHQVGKYDQALEFFQRALEHHPNDPFIHFNLGVSLEEQGRLPEALACYRRVIALNPAHGKAYYKLGGGLQTQGKLEEAAVCYRQALAFDPGNAMIHNNLGVVLQTLGKLEEAEVVLRKALTLNPNYALAHNNLGVVLQKLGKPDAALDCYRRALAFTPDYAEAHNNLGSALQDLGRLNEAVTSYREALRLKPDYDGAQWNLSTALLMRGEYHEGFALYEKRFAGADSREVMKARETLARLSAVPRWQGEDLHGMNLLVWTEQGLGDSLMMLRYLPLLKERGVGRIVVFCQPELTRIMQTLSAVDRVIGYEEPMSLEGIDRHCPLMSLPCLFDTRLETIPKAVPYIAFPDVMAARWRQRLAGIDGVKVGLVWAGSEAQKKDYLRSIPLDRLAPLLAVPGARFISLQKGASARGAADFGLLDWMAECRDFMDTAALIQQLDLVIAVDTAVAHLAGALARPVWLLNRFESEWRWMLGREDSPWYPTLRIFRQPAIHDWESVIERLVTELADWVAKKSRN